MKNIISKIKWVVLTTTALFLTTSCSSVLDEQPRTGFDPSFFSTKQGVEGGVTSLYAHLRYIYGQAYYYNSCLTGTDEYTYGQSADGNFKDADLSGAGTLDATSSRSDALWGTAFPNINTASGIIENAESAGVGSDLVAEARFFRAFDYFLLVQTFGGVPLDLGAGELKFNTSTSRTSVRNTVPEVYTKGIFPDLKQAITDLPETGRVTGGVTKTVARLYLSKAYLTYAWWLENPNNIPTYPETARTDPDGHDAAWYFQQAYDIATEAIANPGPFGLQKSFYLVNQAENDRNNEILLYADHTEDSELYNGGSLTYGSGGAPDNFAGWMVGWNYETMRSYTDNAQKNAVKPIWREASQALGRPWTRMAPPVDVFLKTFADKTNDSRCDGTFNMAYRANWGKGGQTWDKVYNANNLVVKDGEVILTFLNEDNPNVKYSDAGNGVGNIGAATIDGRADYVINPSAISRVKFPSLWKLGPYRTDNNGGLGQPNAGSTRPFPVAKFSELYFIAAEAAVKGATTTAGKTARDLINVIRGRAGVWSWDNAANSPKVQDNSEAMKSTTPATIDIKYILAERSREYFGEGYRWFDLVRTQTWANIAGEYRICGSGWNDHELKTYTRQILPTHYLRPIPQGQLDGMEMTEAEKDAYQNPGY
ncbi:RagB/SusD family nutrient uptake outer membrane protein [Phocaeicola paurosaccharolyticus]|uniref:RagB/SusD family nutrient uptake outer membrane protein n=1 Tax=Phocaeicola paurosaccharolyticus TaxID=732242 RepID=UPI002FDFBFEF